jgi:hypothetical protein
MNKRTIIVAVAALLLAVALFVPGAPQASAHEEREVGEYSIVFGWQVEPAYAGVYNGPEVSIHQHGANDEEVPVEGAEETVALTVKFGYQSKELALEPAWNDPGHYVVSLTPTRPGDYTFELTGTIDDVEVDETFSSADGEFSSIEPASDVLFPDSKLDMVALQSQVDALKKQVDALKKDLDALKAAK